MVTITLASSSGRTLAEVEGSLPMTVGALKKLVHKQSMCTHTTHTHTQHGCSPSHKYGNAVSSRLHCRCGIWLADGSVAQSYVCVLCAYVCACAFTCVKTPHTHTHTQIQIPIHSHIHTYICTHTHTYIHKYIHAHTPIFPFSLFLCVLTLNFHVSKVDMFLWPIFFPMRVHCA